MQVKKCDCVSCEASNVSDPNYLLAEGLCPDLFNYKTNMCDCLDCKHKRKTDRKYEAKMTNTCWICKAPATKITNDIQKNPLCEGHPQYN